MFWAGFEILAFPCNQFAGQEPGSNEEIQEVVCTMFKAEFPIFDKVIPHKQETNFENVLSAIHLYSSSMQIDYSLCGSH